MTVIGGSILVYVWKVALVTMGKFMWSFELEYLIFLFHEWSYRLVDEEYGSMWSFHLDDIKLSGESAHPSTTSRSAPNVCTWKWSRHSTKTHIYHFIHSKLPLLLLLDRNTVTLAVLPRRMPGSLLELQACTIARLAHIRPTFRRCMRTSG